MSPILYRVMPSSISSNISTIQNYSSKATEHSSSLGFRSGCELDHRQDFHEATYIPYGSFQIPHSTQEPFTDVNSISVSSSMEARPLHACPGLPRPNREMKYFSWKTVNDSSHVNLAKMTHCDHSKKSLTRTPRITTDSGIDKCLPLKDPVDEDELNAAITLTSCFKGRKKPRKVSEDHDWK